MTTTILRCIFPIILLLSLKCREGFAASVEELRNPSPSSPEFPNGKTPTAENIQHQHLSAGSGHHPFDKKEAEKLLEKEAATARRKASPPAYIYGVLLVIILWVTLFSISWEVEEDVSDDDEEELTQLNDSTDSLEIDGIGGEEPGEDTPLLPPPPPPKKKEKKKKRTRRRLGDSVAKFLWGFYGPAQPDSADRGGDPGEGPSGAGKDAGGGDPGEGPSGDDVADGAASGGPRRQGSAKRGREGEEGGRGGSPPSKMYVAPVLDGVPGASGASWYPTDGTSQR